MQLSLSMLNDKLYFLITTQKVASTWVLKYYNEKNYPNQPPVLDELYNPNLEWDDKKEIWKVSKRGDVNGYLDGDKNETELFSKEHNDALSTFNKWLKGKITKDIIILIRDPQVRWESAFIQDYIRGFFQQGHNNFNFNMRTILRSSKFSTSDIYQAWIDNPYDLSGNNIHHPEDIKGYQEDKFYLQCEGVKVLMKEYLVEVMNDTHHIWFNHNKLYHTLLLQILSEIKDKNNIKIIDIDKSNLEKVMNKYEVGASQGYGRHNQSGILRKLLREVLNDEIQGSPELQDFGAKLHSKLKFEQNSYNLLSKYRDKNFDI